MERLETLKEENDPEGVEESLLEAFEKSVVKDAKAILEEYDTSELETLRDEMTSWRDNYPDNLRSTSKFEEVDTAASELENMEETAPDVDSIDDIESAIEELERRAEELENVQFPGMY